MDVFFDGSLRGGVMRTCVYVPRFQPQVETWPSAKRETSGHSEWLAARAAARFADSQCDRSVLLLGDCQNIFRHMDARRPDAARCSVPENVQIADEIDRIVAGMRARDWTVTWCHVTRDKNLAGVHLDAIWTVGGSEPERDFK
jgi:hypothetical protein